MRGFGTVFEKEGYIVTQHLVPESKELEYNVYSPTGELVLGNRPSLEDAKAALDKYVRTGGYKKWESIGSLVSSSTFIKGLDIDPEIREVVRELNSRGLTTEGSCAGHLEPGFIAFSKKSLTSQDRAAVRAILGSKDIQIIAFKDASRSTPFSTVVFREIGKEQGASFW